MLPVAHAYQYRGRRFQHQPGPDQCLARITTELVAADRQNRPASLHPDDLHRAKTFFGSGLDGADCRRNARPKPGLRQICLG